MADNDSFLACVRRVFGFLENEYAYVSRETLYGSDPWADGIVEYSSTNTMARIGKDRNSIFVALKPADEPEIATQSLSSVVIALGVMKEDDFPGPVAPAQYEKALEFYGETLRKHCMPFIEGDFSRWTEILRYHLNWMRSRYGRKLPPETYSELETFIDSRESA